jgi:hypothetical protein
MSLYHNVFIFNFFTIIFHWLYEEIKDWKSCNVFYVLVLCHTDRYGTWQGWVLRTQCTYLCMNMPSTAHQNLCDRVILCVTFMKSSVCCGLSSGIISSRRYLCSWQVVSRYMTEHRTRCCIFTLNILWYHLQLTGAEIVLSV